MEGDILFEVGCQIEHVVHGFNLRFVRQPFDLVSYFRRSHLWIVPLSISSLENQSLFKTLRAMVRHRVVLRIVRGMDPFLHTIEFGRNCSFPLWRLIMISSGRPALIMSLVVLIWIINWLSDRRTTLVSLSVPIIILGIWSFGWFSYHIVYVSIKLYITINMEIIIYFTVII